MVGTLGFSTPALIVATALLVVDIGVRTSLAGDVLVSAVCLPLLSPCVWWGTYRIRRSSSSSSP